MSKNKTYNARGIAEWPWINKPDTKYKEEGEYKVDLVVPADVAVLHLRRITATQEAALVETQEKLKGKKAKPADLPIQPKLDEEGNETGNYVIKCRSRASGISKKTGKNWQRSIPIFDCSSPPKEANIRIFGGAELVVAWKEEAWANPKGEVGVKLYLEGVQVITSGGQPSASRFGFGAEDGGFTASDNLGEDDTSDGDDAPFDTEEGQGDGEAQYNF